MTMKTFVKGVFYFRNKCVVFARNCKFAHLTQCNMQYIPYISALFRGVPALYQSLGGSGKGYPDPSSRLASRVELPKITISVVETSPSEE